MKALTSLQRLSPPTYFLLLGSILEILFLLTCMLLPFNIALPAPSSTDTIRHWISMPAQSLVLKTSIPIFKLIDLSSHVLLLSLLIIALSSIYLYVVGNTFHARNNIPISSIWLLVPLIGATTFGITLLFFPALFNHEAQNYMYNSVALLSHLINCVLIWAILDKIAPERRLTGTLLYAWNPLALIELAGYGNNNGLLLFFLLLTTLLIIQLKGSWYDFGGMVFFGCALAMNSIALLFAPIMIYFCRLHKIQNNIAEMAMPALKQPTTTDLSTPGRDSTYYLRLLWIYTWRAIVALVTAFALSLLFQQRNSIYTPIFPLIDMQSFIRPPLSIIAIPVQLLNSFLFHILYPPTGFSSKYLQAIPTANMAVQALVIYIFVLIYIYLLIRVRSVDSLLTSLCLAALGFLLLLSGQFWLWYILWVVWIVALRRFDTLSMSVLLLTCTALLTYPLLYLDNLQIAIYQPLLIFGIPLIYLVLRLIRSNERLNIFYERRSETAKN